jgi:transketolase
MLNSTEGNIQTGYANPQKVANGIRLRVLEHILKNKGGYMSQACSSAEIFATLYTRVLNLGPSTGPMIPVPFPGVPGPANPHPFTGAIYNGPKGAEYDRLFVSPGHFALVLYATLIEVGRLAPEALDSFNQDGSTVEMIGAEHSPGFESMAGSLAQALSQASGVAMARRLHGEPGRVFVFLSDGEMQEGQTWEAFATLSFYKLDNVGVYVDVNGHQCDGEMEAVMNIDPLAKRLESFGAEVFEVDGHDVEALAAPAAQTRKGKPFVVLAHTSPFQGVPLLARRAPKFHYLRFKDEQEYMDYEALYQQLIRANGSE